MQEGRRDGGEVRQIRADIGQRFGAQRQEIALHVGGKFDGGDMIAAMRVGQERFRPVRHPFHRATDFAGCSQNKGFFAVVVDFGAKPTAHIGGDNIEFMLGDAHHEGGHQQAGQVRVLTGGVKFVILGARIIDADACAGFHRVGDEAVVDQLQRRHMRRGFEGGVNGGAVVLNPAPVVADVVGYLVMHAVCAVGDGGGHIHNRRQFFKFDFQGFHCVAGDFDRLGNNGGVGVTNMTHLAMRQNRALWFFHRLAVAALHQPACGVAAHGHEIRAGEHGKDTFHRLRC